ncbi:hypothetical protein QJS10_CPA05g01892 [Acorus calamus]|uniref:SAM domain-containing protein n=1 Tax=Acorus calamus TaxID=4465 RepID=A0AAV9ESR0_ACOCL|nr:hypothetical protein QJS10_CPA05g01892 [Acorus calamus]
MRAVRKENAEEPQLTVPGLLNSLGLGKYSIIFQAEEVDMTALKQMGDNDLKDLGIPMGCIIRTPPHSSWNNFMKAVYKSLPSSLQFMYFSSVCYMLAPFGS